MTCALATAALAAVCATLPELGDAPFAKHDIPAPLRGMYASYKSDKTVLKREFSLGDASGRIAIGSTKWREIERLYKGKKGIYGYIEWRPHDQMSIGGLLEPQRERVSLVLRWEFE